MFPILLSQPQDIFEQLRLICNPNYTLKKKIQIICFYPTHLKLLQSFSNYILEEPLKYMIHNNQNKLPSTQ